MSPYDGFSKTTSASGSMACSRRNSTTFCTRERQMEIYVNYNIYFVYHKRNRPVSFYNNSTVSLECLILYKLLHINFFLYIYRLLEQGQHSDVKFLVHGQIFTAHRCILSARSEYFTRMFETKWVGKNLITLKHPLVDKNPYSGWLILCDLLALKKNENCMSNMV